MAVLCDAGGRPAHGGTQRRHQQLLRMLLRMLLLLLRMLLLLLLLLPLWATLLTLAPRLRRPPPSPQPPPPAATSPPGLAATTTTLMSATDREMLVQAARQMPSLAMAYWHAHKDDKGKFYKNSTCAPFPSIYQLEFHNSCWQTLLSSNGTFYVYGAYLDRRAANPLGPAVRVQFMLDRLWPAVATHCQLWFEHRAEPVLVRSRHHDYVFDRGWINPGDAPWQPYFTACELPPEVRHLVPAAVSLVERACDAATNLLRVYYDAPPPRAKRREFAVCVKGLDFLREDISVRLVEWIELLRLLGAHKIFMYELQVHPNISKVLRYYEKLDVVSITPFTLPGGHMSVPGLQHVFLKKKLTRQMQMIPYNDCLYRNMYHYRWLVLLDVDEVIVPLKDADWSALMRRVLPLATPDKGEPPRSSYHASNLYFLDTLVSKRGEAGVPRYMHMLQHVYHTSNFTEPGTFVKAFHETDRVLALHNHFPLACLHKCSSYQLPTHVARLQHYRGKCKIQGAACLLMAAHPVRDTAVWRWRGPLLRRAAPVLHTLRLVPPA